jgi:inner membrane organizing system protein 1
MTATTSEIIQQKTQRPASEDLLSEKAPPTPLCLQYNTDLEKQWDQCLSNLVVKSALGAGFGIVFSVLLFKRRAWPATIGLGFGAGRGYAECDREFKGAAGGVTKAVGERLQRP